MKNISRRDFLKTLGASGVVLVNRKAVSPSALGDIFTNNPLNVPGPDGLFGIFEPSSAFTINARPTEHELLPGKTTRLWNYEVSAGGKTYSNPVIKIRKDAAFSATLNNDLTEPTIIHWHGLHVPATYDGHPADAIQPAGQYHYDFQILNRAAACWYHTHAHERTAQQVYYGLAGLFIVEDEDDERVAASLDLQFGQTDIPLVLQDRTFAANGDLLYYQTPMGAMDGFLGDTVLTNLTYRPYLDISSRIYRFRILNGSNARIYRLAFIKGFSKMPFYVIGNDGGLLDRPYQVSEVFLAPGERVDVLLDAGKSIRGEVIRLKSLPFTNPDTGMGGMMGGGMGMMQPGALPNGTPFTILKHTVTEKTAYDRRIPDELSTIPPIDLDRAGARDFSLNFFIMRWFINGWSFEMDEVPVKVEKDSTGIWRIENPGPGGNRPGPPMGMMGMMNMAHPMHLHGFLFRVLQRINSPLHIRRLAVDADGLLPTDKGVKDTVLVWPGETVRIAVDFSHGFTGTQRYVFHCHILEHSDNGMMINYEVV